MTWYERKGNFWLNSFRYSNSNKKTKSNCCFFFEPSSLDMSHFLQTIPVDEENVGIMRQHVTVQIA